MARNLFFAALAAGATLSGYAAAFDSVALAPVARASTASPSPLEVAEASYPPCALKCLEELIPKSSCAPTDVPCLCTNVPLNGNLTICVAEGCTLMESLTTKNVSMTMCGAPVRNKSYVSSLVGEIGGSIALLAFLVRMAVCSPWLGRKIGYEDYAIAIGFGLTVPPTVFTYYLGKYGLGRDIWTLSLNQIEHVLFFYFMGELFYVTAQSMIKISLVLFFLRIFPDATFRKACWATLALTVAYGFTFFIVTLFQCLPIDYMWKQLDETQHGTCSNENVQGWAAAIVNIILDVTILVLPLKQLYLLQMGTKKKIMTMCMFGLGIFDTVISIVRLRSLITFANSENITWAYLDAAYWSVIEMQAGIVTACLPAVRIFFIKIGLKKLGSTRGNSRPTNNTGSKPQLSSDNRRPQGAPRRGDESDFIPLVDVESAKHKAMMGRAGSATSVNDVTVKTESLSHSEWSDK